MGKIIKIIWAILIFKCSITSGITLRVVVGRGSLVDVLCSRTSWRSLIPSPAAATSRAKRSRRPLPGHVEFDIELAVGLGLALSFGMHLLLVRLHVQLASEHDILVRLGGVHRTLIQLAQVVCLQEMLAQLLVVGIILLVSVAVAKVAVVVLLAVMAIQVVAVKEPPIAIVANRVTFQINKYN